jgi:phosphoribosylamine--glycine ligase
MKILVIGGGGREHALTWKLAQSRLVDRIYCAPGNPGTAAIAENVDLPINDVEAMADFAETKRISLTVVGPELPLTLGIVDAFEKRNLKIFGPSKAAAALEGSKVFSKRFMQRHGIPTANAEIFHAVEPAILYLKKHGLPIVVKADGLAAGKGVIVAQTEEEAVDAIRRCLETDEFGTAGKTILLEDCLVGVEASILAITDGNIILPLPAAQDHKRIFDGDTGPNTGGMGAYSPTPVITPSLSRHIFDRVLEPTVRGMRKDGNVIRGILYAGIMLTPQGPSVLEFNCRFGDPECEPLMLRWEDDAVPILLKASRGDLDKDTELNFSPDPAISVVMAAANYPGTPRKGDPIHGLEEAAKVEGVQVFHAGTALKDGQVVTAGGRVLAVSARGKDVRTARDRAYEAVAKITWEGAQYRKDIAYQALESNGQ